VSRCQKGKTNLDFTEARDSEWQWHQLGRMQVCISLQTDNHTNTPSLGFLQAGCPSCRPTNSVKALKAVIGKNIHGPGPAPSLLPPSSSSSSIFLPFPSSFPSAPSSRLPSPCPEKYAPLNTARGSGERCKQWVDGSWVNGSNGSVFWMGHTGHGSMHFHP